MTLEIKATQAGQEQELAQKRASEERPFSIDCTDLLREYELIVKVLSVSANGLTTGAAQTRTGTDLEVILGGGSVPSNLPSKDFKVLVTAQTTQGTLAVSFGVRVYKV